MAESKKKKKIEKKPAPAAPVSSHSTGVVARMGIKGYVRFKPDAAWAASLASRYEQMTLREWDSWYQGILRSSAK